MKFNSSITIGKHRIDNDSRVFIIAEAGVNHNGDMSLAKRLVDVAAEARVDAIKFQSFRTEELILDSVTKADYQKSTTGSNESQFEMLKRLELSLSQTLELRDYCLNNEILFMTTPFDEFSLNELDVLDLPAYKISSTDLTNIPFLRNVARKNKPIILSTGMSYLAEIEQALSAIHPLNQDVILLQCTANYPTEDGEVNLNVLKTYRDKFDILLGFSDHSSGIGAAPYSVMFGAKVIEKHFTLDKNMKGPDHKASLSPEELRQLVKEIDRASKFCGTYQKQPSVSEIGNRGKMQKCLVASTSIVIGEQFSESNIVGKRTGGVGISALEFDKLKGRKSTANYKINDIIAEFE